MIPPRFSAGFAVHCVLLCAFFSIPCRGYLTPFTVSPTFVPDVDANQFITYVLTTTAIDAHAFSVNITDVHAIAPSNYSVYWIRMNPPSPDMPKPPVLSQYDPSLIFLFGDVGATFLVRDRNPRDMFMAE